MEDKAYTYIFYDILDKVLQLSENPTQFSAYLSQQIRELIGARTVVIVIKNSEAKPEIFSVYPIRRIEWCKQPAILKLAEIAFDFKEIKYLSGDDTAVGIDHLISSLAIEKVIAIPLRAANEVVGSILLLDIMDLFGIDAVIDLLTRLSGVFALIIRNSLLYHNLERVVTQRTNELQTRNSELIEREQELKSANEEYEALNEELSENIERMVEVNLQLEQAKSEAEENDRLKTAFLQNMSHEIRTPMNAIVGFTTLLNKPDLTPEKRKSFTSIIQTSTHQLLSVVSDILTISSLETKQEKLNIGSVCVNSLIVNLLATFKPQAERQNISLYARQQTTDEQSTIYADQTKTVQILTNLLTNALKFTHHGFIEFGYNIQGGQIEFYVKDSGIGIETQQQTKIFERFVQADSSIQQNYGGTGLGLSICKGFVELMGGEIWVESVPNQGSVFYFTIPYKPVFVHNTNINTLQTCKHCATILVAEDEEYNFLLIEEVLSDLTPILIHAKNGREAVEVCSTNPDIALVLMDIKMPVMSGYTAASMIKKMCPDLPVIAQTAYALAHEQEKYQGVFDDYITKPIKGELLRRIIAKHLKPI